MSELDDEPAVPYIELMVPDVYYGYLMQMMRNHDICSELQELMDSYAPQFLQQIGMSRIRQHGPGCTCHIAHVPMTKPELEELLLIFPPEGQMFKYLREALDRLNVYELTEELSNVLPPEDGNAS